MFDTDKSNSGLISEYEKILLRDRNKSIKYMEIGIHKGGSIDWANEFFENPSSSIMGVDIKLPKREWPQRVLAIKGDQSNQEELMEIAKHNGPYDIVIDDGCHFSGETEKTFNAFWHQVKSGGVYIIEDWGAAYNHANKKQYAGMPELILRIMAKKEYHSISDVKIVCTAGMSYAAFWRK